MKRSDRSPGTPSWDFCANWNGTWRRVAGLLSVFALLHSVYACEDLTVRDAAFSEPRDEHRLYVIANADDPKGAEIEGRLAEWLVGSASGLNGQLRKIAADDPETDWSEVGVPSAPPALPVVVLVGNDVTARRAFYIQHWEPEPTPGDLATLLDSPARKKIREAIGGRMAKFLHVPGTVESGTDTTALMDSVIADWAGRERLGIEKITLDRADPDEKILLSFLGVPEEGPDWVGVVFGKGKIMPPLEGDEINEFGLNEHLSALAQECTCLATASKLGVDIPLVWSGADDVAFQYLREAEEAPDTVVASVNWNSMKTTGMVLCGLAAFILLAAAGLFLRRSVADRAPLTE